MVHQHVKKAVEHVLKTESDSETEARRIALERYRKVGTIRTYGPPELRASWEALITRFKNDRSMHGKNSIPELPTLHNYPPPTCPAPLHPSVTPGHTLTQLLLIIRHSSFRRRYPQIPPSCPTVGPAGLRLVRAALGLGLDAPPAASMQACNSRLPKLLNHAQHEVPIL